MGFEDREYYRDEYQDKTNGGIPGFRFDRQSVIVSLIVINVVLFVIDMFSPRLSMYDMLPASERGADGSVPVAAIDGVQVPVDKIQSTTQWLAFQLSLKSDRAWQVWTFLTYGFVHTSVVDPGGITHIIMNMLTLFFLGPPVESKLGRNGFLVFYLLAIIFSGLVWYLWVTVFGESGYCLGASGAVSAVVIYFIFLNPRAELLLMGLIPMPAWIVGVLFLLANLSYAIGNSGIAWQAHLAGGAFGLAAYRMNWNFSGVPLPDLSRRKSKLKIHQPAAIDERLQQDADRILAKIAEQGESSLTGKERRTLKKYSNQIRKQRK